MIAEHEQADAARLLLATIRDGHGLVELRGIKPGRKGAVCRWYNDPAQAVEHARGAARGIDLYVGAVARARRGSGRDSLCDAGRHAWADLDTVDAVDALAGFPIAPSFLIESGGATPEGVPRQQAWWLTTDRLTLGAVELLNRRLALALGGDPHAVDATRVLRMPGTVNRKTGHAARILDVGDDVAVHELAAALPALEPRLTERRIGAGTVVPLAATEYVPRLSGCALGRDGKVPCPFHADRTPSLHCYADPARGWYCYGCRQGGDVFTFAGLFWGLDPRTEFPELRRRALDALGLEVTA